MPGQKPHPKAKSARKQDLPHAAEAPRTEGGEMVERVIKHLTPHPWRMKGI